MEEIIFGIKSSFGEDSMVGELEEGYSGEIKQN